VRGLQQVHKATTTKAWRHCRISIVEMQICLQALCFLSAYNTIDTTASAHISSYYAKLYFETRIPQILLISERGRRSNIAFITKIFQLCCRKK